MSRTAFLALLGAMAMAPCTANADPVDVTQKNKSFEPGEVTIHVGDSVVFHNEDPITHNMFSRTDGHEFNLKMQKPGHDMEQRFDTAGQAVVRCAIHPKMKLIVNVEEP